MGIYLFSSAALSVTFFFFENQNPLLYGPVFDEIVSIHINFQFKVLRTKHESDLSRVTCYQNNMQA